MVVPSIVFNRSWAILHLIHLTVTSKKVLTMLPVLFSEEFELMRYVENKEVRREKGKKTWEEKRG